LHYVTLGDFARHLFELERQNKIEDLERIFELIERFNFEGDDNVQNAVVVGLLENLKMSPISNGEVFVKYLGNESLKWWSEIGKFWKSEIQNL
jgi:hypothetical protein